MPILTKRSGIERSDAVGRIGGVALAALLGFGCLAAHADDVARGDAAWDRRAEGEREGRPLRGPIRESVRAYERAIADRPERLEARWKLLRSLHFAGDFATSDEDESGRIFERAREVSEQGLDLLAAAVDSRTRLEEMDPDTMRGRLEAAGIPPRDVARLYFWSAINWGAWSRDAGLLTAVRRGVANRVHRYTSVTLALEPEYDEGAALRLLGRLHAELPRVPFVSGWVDRNASIPLLEEACEIAPRNPGNRLLLALTLLDLAPERRGQAVDLLRQVEALTPRASMRIEDLAVRREAGVRLTEVSDREKT